MSRISWIDYARGLAIFGVVMWHVVGGVVASGVPTTEGFAIFGDLWDMYTFRLMPIFFFLSGAFFLKALSRPSKRVMTNKLRSIAYPYFVWSLIMLIIGSVTVQFRNGTETLADLPRLFYDPILHFWFLFALLVIMFLTYIAYAIKLSRWIILGFTLIMFIFSAATQFYNVWYVGGQIGYFAIYFIAGLWVGSDFLKRIEDAPVRTHIIMFIACAIALILIPINEMNQTALNWQPLAATLSMLMTINLAVILAKYKMLDFIRSWGQLSLEIYLVHVLALSSVRIVLFNIFGIQNAWIHIIVGIICGLYVPILVKWISDKAHTNILFSAPNFNVTMAEPAKVGAE